MVVRLDRCLPYVALVFNLSHTAASRYTSIAQNLLDNQIGQTAESE